MQPTHERQVPDDEIDVRSIGKRFYNFIASSVSLLISNLFTTLLFVLVAVLLAVSLKYLIPRSYKSSFVIRPNDRHERFHLKMFADIRGLLSRQDYATLSKELGLSETQVQQINEIEFVNPTFKVSPDSINYTEVTLQVSDHNLLLPLQNSLLNYLESNPYFAKVRGLQEKLIAVELAEVTRDLRNIDSLKVLQLVNYGRVQAPTQNALLLNDLVEPTAYYTLGIERVNKRQTLIARQNYLNNFELIKSCVVVKIHNWPPRILVISAVLVPFFLICCVAFLHARTRSRGHGPNA